MSILHGGPETPSLQHDCEVSELCQALGLPNLALEDDEHNAPEAKEESHEREVVDDGNCVTSVENGCENVDQSVNTCDKVASVETNRYVLLKSLFFDYGNISFFGCMIID